MEIQNKRKFTRVDIGQQVKLDFEGISYDTCKIKDMSLTGMFVVGTINQKIGDECTIKFSQATTETNYYFKARAKIVRMTDDGIGIEYISMPFDSYSFLQTILLYESDNPLEIGSQIPEDCPFKITSDPSRES